MTKRIYETLDFTSSLVSNRKIETAENIFISVGGKSRMAKGDIQKYKYERE